MSSDPSNGKTEAPTLAETARKDGVLGFLASLRARLMGTTTLRDTLESALEKPGTGEHGAFSAEEREMLSRLLRFGGMKVEDLMVPRADITAIDESEPLRELIKTFEEAGVSRVPLFHETLDDPRGMVHIKDLFRWLAAEAAGREMEEPKGRVATRADGVEKPAASGSPGTEAPVVDYSTRLDLSRPISAARIRRQVLFVPPSMPAVNLLVRMQTSRVHMALIVDEYGGTDGLVTIEDLVEQIVGDIEDEHDEAEAALISTDAKPGLVAAARAPVKELEERLGLTLLTPEDEEDIDTVGGLVAQIAGRVPVRGELVHHKSGVEFEVLDADPRRVKKVRVHKPKTAGAASGA
jgi:CBS domain containing-hemolysin-like protein